MSPDNRELLAHVALALTKYAKDARRDAIRNGSTVPRDLIALAEFIADCATVRQDATHGAPSADPVNAGRMTDSLLLRKSEAAATLQVSVRQLERLIATGVIPKVPVGDGVRIRRTDLEAYVQSLTPTRRESFRNNVTEKDTV